MKNVGEAKLHHRGQRHLVFRRGRQKEQFTRIQSEYRREFNHQLFGRMAFPGLEMTDIGNGGVDPSSQVLLGQIECSAPFAHDLTKTSTCKRRHLPPLTSRRMSLSKQLNRL